MRMVDVVVAFPFYVLIIALVFVLGPGERSIYIAITVVGWVSYARLVRAEILVAKRQEYVLAAQAGGLSNLRIMGRHLLPNVISQSIIYAMSDIVQDILAIVTLGLLRPRHPAAHGGVGINDQRRAELPVHALGADHDSRYRRRHRRAGPFADRRRARRPAPAGPVVTGTDSTGTDGAGPRGTGRDEAGWATAAGTGPMLEVTDLHVQIASRRGLVRAVDGVSFEVVKGDALGIVGESGSGKSMTLRAILGVLPPEARITSVRSSSMARIWCRCASRT